MNPDREAKLKELEDNAARTPEEEALRVALLELDEREENLAEAKSSVPTPDPVAEAQTAVDTALQAVEAAEAAVVVV